MYTESNKPLLYLDGDRHQEHARTLTAYRWGHYFKRLFLLRRHARASRRSFKLLVLIAIIIPSLALLFSLILAALFPVYTQPPLHYRELRKQVEASDEPGRANPNNEKVFIAANIINAELVKGAWGASVRELVEILGPGNTFLSIYENDSGPEVTQALKDLGALVKCNASIIGGAHIELAELPHIALPPGIASKTSTQAVTRLEYLSTVRNHALHPLDREYNSTEPGFTSASTRVDKILFLNDVYFSAIDAANLLFSTNRDRDGVARYEAACAVDFVSVTNFYDAFATRDLDGRGLGYGPGFRIFPWFAPGPSRSDVLRGSDAVRVRSCWGGMAAFNAVWFQEGQQIDSSQGNETPLVRFRAEKEPFWESCECCLINADITHRYQRSLKGQSRDLDTGIYMNPYIRTAYTRTTYSWLSTLARLEHGFSLMQYLLTLITQYPEVSERSAERPGELVTRKVWRSYDEDGQHSAAALASSGKYEMIEQMAEPGGFCGRRGLEYMLEGQDLINGNARGQKNFAVVAAPSVPWS